MGEFWFMISTVITDWVKDVGNQEGVDEQNENEDEIANEVAELAR